MNASRIPALDSLRGVAILMVATTHFLTVYAFTGPADDVFGSMGLGGVLLFFLLSGYLIFRNIERQPIPLFLARRCFKLLPAYWVNIFVIALMGALAPEYYPKFSGAAYAANFVMLPDLFREPLVNLNFWTLVIEIRFYLLIALQYYFLSNRRVLIVPAAILLANTGFWFLYGRGSVLLTYLPIFYIGIEIYRAEKDGWPRSSYIRLGAVSATLAVSMLLFSKDHWPIAQTIYLLTLPPLFIVVLRNRWYHVWFSFFGRISYSFYLFHAWVVGYSLYRYLETSAVFPFVQVIIACILSLLTAYLSYIWIEAPGVNLGRRIEKRWWPRSNSPTTVAVAHD